MEISRDKTLRDWITAVRPWSFTTSSVPVLFSLAYLFYLCALSGGAMHTDWWNAVLCLPMMMLLHAAGNLISDYYDYTRGVDGPDCPNGVTWIRSGLFSPREVLAYGRILLCAGAAIGLILLLRTGFSALWLAAFALLVPLLYFYLKAHALGDLDILIGFALLPTLGTVYVATGIYHPETLLLCLPFGLHIVAILHANNTRDIASDRRAGLITLAGKAGPRLSRLIYIAEITLPYVLVAVFIPLLSLTPWPLLVLLTLPRAVRNIRTMLSSRQRGAKSIATLDQATAQYQMMFGMLYTIGFVIGGIMEYV